MNSASCQKSGTPPGVLIRFDSRGHAADIDSDIIRSMTTVVNQNTLLFGRKNRGVVHAGGDERRTGVMGKNPGSARHGQSAPATHRRPHVLSVTGWKAAAAAVGWRFRLQPNRYAASPRAMRLTKSSLGSSSSACAAAIVS